MIIFMLYLNNGIIKCNPEKERLLGRYNYGIVVAYWYPEKEKNIRCMNYLSNCCCKLEIEKTCSLLPMLLMVSIITVFSQVIHLTTIKTFV